MDKMVYVSMSGAEQTMLAQAMNANNLANLSTTGFKADLDQFRSQSVLGDGLNTRAYAMAERPATDFTPGPLIPTNRELDIAINGEGWFSVLGKDGKEALTRAGSLEVTSEGLLVTANQLPILGDGGPITLGAFQKLEVGVDGSISVIPEGGDQQTLVLIDRIKMSNPNSKDLFKDTDGLIKMKDGSVAASDASVRVSNGFLEGSNVNAIEAITRVIELARTFELQLKMMNTADQTAQSTTSMLSLS